MKKKKHTINIERLMSTIEASAKVGTLSRGGLCRLSLSDEDKEIRDLFSEWMTDSNLEIRIDDVGNMYGRRPGKNKDATPVVIGSHLDTQAIGGKFDGILGVLASLEVIRILNDHKIETERPIEIVNFTNEEGARFLPSMLGSGAIINAFSTEFLKTVKDSEGKYFVKELERIGYKGKKENRLEDAFCFIELHIEQGPVLEDNEKSIGVVTSIQGLTCFEVTLTGNTSHAGTTPMKNRKDVIKAGAKMIKEAYKFDQIDPNILITVGKIEGHPNVTNSVAQTMKFSVDVRHPEDAIRKKCEQEIKDKIEEIAGQENIEVSIEQVNDLKTEPFSDHLIELVEKTAEQNGYSSMKLVSGAGHDSKYMNAIAPTTMVFIPSIGGVSHCEEEHSTPEDIQKGAQVLLDMVLDLGDRSTKTLV